MGGTIGLISPMYSTTKLIVFTQSTTVQKLPYLCAVWCEPQKCGRSRRGLIESTPFNVASLARVLQSGKKIGLSARIDRDVRRLEWTWHTVGVVAQQRVPIIPPGPRC